jgi:magnesium chelatase family protein
LYLEQKKYFPESHESQKIEPNKLSLDFEVSPFWAKHLLMALLGKHHYLLVGPPGSGKTFFADSLRALATECQPEKSRETVIIDSIFRRNEKDLPWAAPHHSASIVGLLGSVHPSQPGDLSKAHGGILFLDELLEFKGPVLDCMREPLEKGMIELAKHGAKYQFPSRVQLIGACNLCRCGNTGHEYFACRCLGFQKLQYQARLSGPLLERFDVCLNVNMPLVQSSESIKAKEILTRYVKLKNRKANWSDKAEAALKKSKNLLSLRKQNKIKRVAETLALVEGRVEVDYQCVEEAIKYQFLKFDGKLTQ